MKTFYFGCWGDKGHSVWTPFGMHPRPEMAGPWTPAELDASPSDYRGPTGRGVVPEDAEERQGVWRLSHRGGWTAIGCHDYTADSRPGSVSVFVAEGEHDQAAMERIAAEHFPAVWARITRAR